MIRYLLCILLHFSLAHASDWRQCWGQEYLYYDEACCNTQNQLNDAQFHCLNDMPQLANYTDLKETLNKQLDDLNTCVQGVPASPASHSLVLAADQFKQCDKLDNHKDILKSLDADDNSADITVEACRDITLNVMANGGYCRGTTSNARFEARIALLTQATCEAAGDTWEAVSGSTGIFTHDPTFNQCMLCDDSGTYTASSSGGAQIFQAVAGTSGGAPTCSSNETFVELVTEVRLVQENMNNLATNAVETLQPKSTRLNDLTRGKFNDLTLSNGTLVLNDLNASSITIEDVSIGTLDVGFLEVSNLHSDLDLNSHPASNVNFEVLTLNGVDVVTSPQVLSNMNGLSSTLNVSDIALLDSVNGTVVAGKVVIMGTDRLTLDTITIEGTLHMPDGTLTAGLNVLKGVSGINADDFSALSNATTNLDVNTVTTSKVKMISQYDPTTTAYAGTACNTSLDCQLACDKDASCSGYSNLISCTDPIKLTEVDCINSCEDGGVIENE